MRTYLFLLLAVVTIVLLWAIRNESYQNGLVFTLGLLSTGLCGYLLADFFWGTEKKTLVLDLSARRKEIDALKEQTDLLQTQIKIATPHAQVEQLEQRIAVLDDEKHKLDGITRQQTAEIAAMRGQLERLLYQKEEADISSETSHSEVMSLQDNVATLKERLKLTVDENAWLRGEIARLQGDVAAQTAAKTVEIGGDTEGVIRSLIGEETVEISAETTAPDALPTAKSAINQETILIETATVLTAKSAINQEAQVVANQSVAVESMRDPEFKNLVLLDISEQEQAQVLGETLGETERELTLETPTLIAEPVAESTEILAETLGELEPEAETEVIAEAVSETVRPIDSAQVLAETIGEPDAEETAIAESVSDQTRTLATESNGQTTTVFERHPVYGGSDNLRAIEGIGPKAELLLKENGIRNWGDLAAAPTEMLADMFENAGSKYQSYDPTTWTHQASLLSEGKYDEFKDYVGFLKSGLA